MEGFGTTITDISNTQKATAKPIPTGPAKDVEKAIPELNEQRNGMAVQCVNHGKYVKYDPLAML